MRKVIALTCTLAAAPAAAQPTCAVTIVRAPDDVRAAVEKWVSAEERCSRSLELRAVATADGIYLMGRDDHGRIFERTVPDAQSAGVLVASWIADDAVAPPEPPAAPVAEPAPAPVAAPAAPPLETPALRPAMEAPPATPTFTTPDGRWLTVGAMRRLTNDGFNGYGARVELEVASLGNFRVGAAIETSKVDQIDFYYGSGKVVDTRATATFGRTFALRNWTLRAQVGAGVARVGVDAASHHGAGVFPVFEGELLVGPQLHDWALGVGPVVSWSKQSLREDIDYDMPEIMYRDGNVMLFAALRRRM